MGDSLASGELEGEGEKEMRRGDKDLDEERMGPQRPFRAGLPQVQPGGLARMEDF